MTDDISVYLSGQKLYGDDFTSSQISEWFADETEGYADLGAKNRANYAYPRHQLNIFHAFRHLEHRKLDKSLGLGSAYGDEFLPIVKRISSLTILDPSDTFSVSNEISGTPISRHKPCVDGTIPFESNTFDLITCFGVLHHIPNVSYVVGECYRCLAEGGTFVVMEPFVSMGDWRNPRRGLTKRERGIPLSVFEHIIRDSGFSIERRTLCRFPILPRVFRDTYNKPTLTYLDYLLSFLFSYNTKYHRVQWWEKLGPSTVYFVLRK